MTMNIKDRNRELFESTSGALFSLHRHSTTLCDIANDVDYLHPKLAHDLRMIAKDIALCANEINGNRGEEMSLKIREGEAFLGKIGMLILDKVKEH